MCDVCVCVVNRARVEVARMVVVVVGVVAERLLGMKYKQSTAGAAQKAQHSSRPL